MFAMRDADEVAAVLDLAARGHHATAISRAMGIPRRTVSDWMHARLPRSARPRCPNCGHQPHVFRELPSAYAYLLGAYLGDGCLSEHARAVFRLRVVLDAI